MEAMASNELRGLIFNIQRFSIQDGPGIRTTLFLKGCPLCCRWCSNPESQSAFIEIMTRDAECTKCGVCQDVCPVDAISIEHGGAKVINIDRRKCTLCLKCTDVCPTNAITQVGKWMSIEEVMDEAGRDSQFYVNSGGGITVSGGEPLFQGKFACELLKSCKQKGYHTALDTSGYSAWKVLDAVLNYTDLVLYDIKHLDAKKHKWGTGKGNQLILRNLKEIARRGNRVWLRIPLIEGYNDSLEYIREVAQLGIKMGAEKVSLLPYHEWSRSKYENLDKSYPAEGAKSPSKEYIQQLRDFIQSLGLKATIGN